jgi:hypothetical protein
MVRRPLNVSALCRLWREQQNHPGTPVAQFEPLGLGPGMLPEAAYLGDRPPNLADYLEDAVSAEVDLPASQKMLVVQGIEMNPIG